MEGPQHQEGGEQIFQGTRLGLLFIANWRELLVMAGKVRRETLI